MLLSSDLSTSFYKGTNPITWASLVAQLIKKSTYNVGDLGLIPGLGRSPGEGNSYSSILAWRILWTVLEIEESDMTEQLLL